MLAGYTNTFISALSVHRQLDLDIFPEIFLSAIIGNYHCEKGLFPATPSLLHVPLSTKYYTYIFILFQVMHVAWLFAVYFLYGNCFAIVQGNGTEGNYIFFVEVLRPSQLNGSCRARSVYLITRLLGRISPLCV